jgi:hypothetical protein
MSHNTSSLPQKFIYNFYMSPIESSICIDILDVFACAYPQRLCAAALQGLVNRAGPRIFLDYGIYDDPQARRTNEVFLDDAIWFGKYRALLGNQDQHNLDYYRQAHGFETRAAASLEALVEKYNGQLQGCAVWDASMPDTANVALMLSAQEDLLPVEAGMLAWAESLGLPVRHDLRGRWTDRIALYTWAFEHLFPACKAGWVACMEPGWERPEFVDFLVQHKVFTYSLGSKSGGLGDTLLLLLAFGPAGLREVLFNLRLDGAVRKLGLALQGWKSPETRLATQILRTVKADPYPTIFGWHTRRDDELAFMLHLSANGLRLVPAHLAGNFSFHAQVKPLAELEEKKKTFTTGTQGHKEEQEPVDPQGIYLTFTLSDGDQLMMMSTGEMGSWYSPLRGSVAFNWETQPLLVELAPALFEKYARSATPNDCLVAGPSGAGYIVPPLAPDLPAYLRETRRVCQQAGIQTITFYVGDPPARVLRTLGEHSEGLAGWLGGYAVLGRTPMAKTGSAMFLSNQWPTLPHLWDSAADLLEGVRRLMEAPGARPRFIGVHLFAYRTTLADVVQFAATLNDPHVHIVRADTFLHAAESYTH